ncbi:TonB-dependent receptor domain-containing protein [Nguyenibacter sp. L1]|uniref:TonB-dependent receptor n=1 Tax=Nguyenibacter sp. L1 TaxID=3049350 RepID=UPI002B47A331|nr:TonB-dependent receptor [Nguyenibacter sp. L1]WRH88017.1 TonB-dependent receptor [Nguyenibacter sp. L1]
MRISVLALLSGTVLASSAIAGQAAFAQTVSPQHDPAKATTKAGAAPHGEEIQVSAHVTPGGVTRTAVGGGIMRVETAPKTVQTLSRDYIAKQSPTSNPIQLMAMLPGANVQNADPFGFGGGTVTVRGMTSDQIGWLMEGVPLNDIGGGTMYANEVIDAENLEQMSVQPGSANFDTPTVAASGGLVSMNMRDPAAAMGGYVDAAFGNYNTYRQFARFDTGEIGQSGVRAFVSFSHALGDDWRGPGGYIKRHVDFKLVKDFAGGSHTGLVVAWNNQINQLDNGVSLAGWNNCGFGCNYDGRLDSNNPGMYYKFHRNPFNNVVVSLPTHIRLSRTLSIDDTAYLWAGNGGGGSAGMIGGAGGQTYFGNTPVTVAGVSYAGPAQLVYNPYTITENRAGNNLRATLKTGINELTGGWWYEWSDQDNQHPVEYQQNGDPLNVWGNDNSYRYLMSNGQYYDAYHYHVTTEINMLYVGDRLHLLRDHLLLEAGFKDAMMSRLVTNEQPGAPFHTRGNVNEPLPQVAASYRFNQHHQVYVTGATNFRMPNANSLVTQYDTSGNLTQIASLQKPEYSIEEELGYRYNGSWLVADVAFFNYNFTNRQYGYTVYDQFGGQRSVSGNAGGQTTRGVDIQLGTRPILYHLRPYLSFEYLHARVDNNLIQSSNAATGITTYWNTRGNVAPGSPHAMGTLGLDYDDGHLFGNLNLKYVGSQYGDFMNTEKIPSYIADSITVGYRMNNFGVLKTPQIQLNVSNLANSHYLSGVNGAGIDGGASYYIQAPFSIAGSISAGF